MSEDKLKSLGMPPPFNSFPNAPPFLNGPPVANPAGFQNFMPPPNGMFPPPGSAFPGMPPPFGVPPFGTPPFAAAPFGMPPFGMMPFGGPMSFSNFDDNKFCYSEETKNQMKEVEEKLIKCKIECAIYTEHDTPDGKKYYFNTTTNQSVWDKPKCLIESNELEKKLEELKKKKIIKPIEAPKSSQPKEKEIELNEEEKAKQKSKPISSTAVPGTPWCVVWTRDKRVFFYNPSEKISLWDRPHLLVGRLDVDKLVKEPPAGAVVEFQNNSTSAPVNEAKKKFNDANRTEPPLKKHKVTEEEENVSSKNDTNESPRSGSNSPQTDRSISPSFCNSPNRQQLTEEFLQKEKIEASKEAALEAEHKAAQVRAQLPLEQRIEQFKEMLVEKEISAYSTWEKELQKIVFDPRYLLLTSKERKQVFDKYVKDRANQESKERAAVLKQKKEEYRELMREAGVGKKSSFIEFSTRYARDERFRAVEKMKERESLFNDYQSDLRKHEKEEKNAEKEKLKKNYLALLKEQTYLHRHSSWSETRELIETDPRYMAMESSRKREDYFRDYCKYLNDKVSNGEYRSSQKEKERDNNKEKSKHSEEKSKLEINESNEERDELDEEKTQIEDELRREKEKQERVEASLRERNKQVKEQLSKYQNEREKERDQLKRDESIQCFKALLIDIIKPNLISSIPTDLTKSISTELGWKEAKKIIKKDSRWSYCKVLEKEKKEQLFEEHMMKFRVKKRDLFYQLLDETSGVSLNSAWKEVKKLVKVDPRYEKLQQSDSIKLEKEFENYINEKYQKAKLEFGELLMQIKLINYKSFSLIKENSQQHHLKEIEDILSKDKAYIVLECAVEERKKILLEYIERLHNEGPPPPPTATEPTRRK